jgi:hypothetical protein
MELASAQEQIAGEYQMHPQLIKSRKEECKCFGS